MFHLADSANSSSPSSPSCVPGAGCASGCCAPQPQPEVDPRREIILLLACALVFFGTLAFEDVILARFGLWALRVLYIIPYIACGLSIFKEAVTSIRKGSVFNEFTLMCGATVAAIAIGALPEAVGVMLFYRTGEFFQERAAAGARRSIRDLLAAKPVTARVLESTNSSEGMENAAPHTDTTLDPERVAPREVLRPVESVMVGEVLRVLPGEKIPLDGEVLAGNSDVDQSPLTGESLPVVVEPGSVVLGGTVNLSGALTLRVKSRFADTHMARILDMVEHAATRKSPTERFITRFARYYTPGVVAAAALVALLPPLLMPGETFSTWLYRALVMLVISCPCALIISIPLGYFGGIGAASRQGILVKGGNVLDGVLHIDTVVFDKTGTLTAGAFTVREMAPVPDVSPERLLAAAVMAEIHSNHPIARSIVSYAKAKGLEDAMAAAHNADAREVPGKGMDVTQNGTRFLVGTGDFLRENGIAAADMSHTGAAAHVAENATYLGYILVEDTLKPEARQTVAKLKAAGLKTWMLSGDKRRAAAAVAEELGLDGFEAELLPEAKVEAMERIAGESRAMFVGDGINDAPVLALARVGVAMGGLGAEAAVEAADAVILNDSPAKVVALFQTARVVRNVVRQNIVLALGVKGTFMSLGIVGLSGLWEAIFADVGVALLAVLNAARIMRR